MATNRETLLKFINAQSQRVQDDISQQGYKRDSPYVDRPQNVIKGQPGQPTQITMQGVDKTLMGIDEYGNKKIMHPGQEYEFPGSEVTEIEIAKNGGTLLTKTITCNNCGWKWKAADGGNDIETCHKCGHKNTIMQNGGQKKPVYVESENDPRYIAYQDSLKVYNEGNSKYNNIKKTGNLKDLKVDIDSEKKLPFNKFIKEYGYNDNAFNLFNEGTNKNMKPISISHFRGDGILGYLDYGNQALYKKPQQPVIVKNNNTKPLKFDPVKNQYYAEGTIIQNRQPIQTIQNTLQPIGIQNDFNLEAPLPQIRQQVIQPEYYDVEDYTQGSTNYNGTQTNYITDDLSTLSEQSSNNTRKITPRYQAGGGTYQYAPVPITNGDMYNVDLIKEEYGGQQDMPAVKISPELNTIVQLANDNDKIEELMKITGKSKQSIQNSIINIFDNLNNNILQ